LTKFGDPGGFSRTGPKLMAPGCSTILLLLEGDEEEGWKEDVRSWDRCGSGEGYESTDDEDDEGELCVHVCGWLVGWYVGWIVSE